MAELPTGTVTFLFSDIEGSTRLAQARAAEWPAVLDRHHALLREAFEIHDGREVGTEGDSFFVAFAHAPAAIEAAADAQRALAAEAWPDGLEVRVRMGLHTGDVTLGTDTYVGLNVHRASRIAHAAHGGQVVLSHVTRTLVGDELPAGVELRDLGTHRLRDLDREERIWQLVVDDLRSDFPPLRTLDTPNNLPTRLTTFLGREREIGELLDLLSSHRLVTLTGPGGTGKTRLSIETARRATDRFAEGVYFVELAPIRDPELVVPTIAQTLGLPDRGGRGTLERLADYVGAGHVLLVLDNFEQVIDAASDIGALLEACPNLTVLVSSRSTLHVSGEQEYPVPPLGLPDPGHLPDALQLSQYEAVALFIERARSVRPDFAVTNENAPAVAEICVRLDGLPLAIELAAARIRILTPQAMLSRLSDRLTLLAGGSRDLPERQQTLRGAIAWSHDLLDETDAAMFSRFSVFVGGASLDAIEHTCAERLVGDVLDSLTSLVEKSLVRQREGVDGESRFYMLETIREYAVEQARERGTWDELRARHAAWFAGVAADASTQVMGADKRRWLDRLNEDHDNLRAAMGWAIETAAAEVALRMGADLWRFWQMRGYLREGLERLRQALAIPHASDHPDVRADALSAAAGLAYWLGESLVSRDLYREEIEARTALGDRIGLAYAHYGISFTWAIVEMLDSERAAQANEHVTIALEIFRELDDRSGIARCEWALANVAWGTHRTADAREHARSALEIFEASGDQFMVGWCSYTLALADLTEDGERGGDPELRRRAETFLRRALELFVAADDVSAYTLIIEAFAILALRERDVVRAARLAGAVASLERVSGTGLNAWNRGILGFDRDALRADPAGADAWAEGESLSSREAVAEALGRDPDGVPAGVGTGADA